MNLMPCYMPGYEKQKQEKPIENEARSTAAEASSFFFFFFFAFPFFSSFFYCFLMLVNRRPGGLDLLQWWFSLRYVHTAFDDHRTDLVLMQFTVIIKALIY